MIYRCKSFLNGKKDIHLLNVNLAHVLYASQCSSSNCLYAVTSKDNVLHRLCVSGVRFLSGLFR